MRTIQMLVVGIVFECGFAARAWAQCASRNVCDIGDHTAGAAVPAHSGHKYYWCSCSGDYTISRIQQVASVQDDTCSSHYRCTYQNVYKADRAATPVTLKGPYTQCCNPL
jgi:hypothetical protein